MCAIERECPYVQIVAKSHHFSGFEFRPSKDFFWIEHEGISHASWIYLFRSLFFVWEFSLFFSNDETTNIPKDCSSFCLMMMIAAMWRISHIHFCQFGRCKSVTWHQTSVSGTNCTELENHTKGLVSSNFLWWFYIRRICFSPSFALTQSKNMNTHVYRFQPTTYICLITVASDEFLSDVFTFGLFFYDISIIAQA